MEERRSSSGKIPPLAMSTSERHFLHLSVCPTLLLALFRVQFSTLFRHSLSKDDQTIMQRRCGHDRDRVWFTSQTNPLARMVWYYPYDRLRGFLYDYWIQRYHGSTFPCQSTGQSSLPRIYGNERSASVIVYNMFETKAN